MINLLVAPVLIVLMLVSPCTSHVDTIPLRGYTCKNNAQRPCSLCPDGHFCIDKNSMQQCGAVNFYCPLGSVAPIPVTDGYYTEGPGEALRHSEQRCEAGFYCAGGIKIKCPGGFQCPTPGLSSPASCGRSNVFCEEGSIQPTQVREGYYSVGGTNTTRHGQQISPKGYYAVDGMLLPCKTGHFGSTEGLSNDRCSGECDSGWYCPESSISSRQIACGGEDRFCPSGSASPTKVSLGFYTSTDDEPCRPGMYREPTPDDDVRVSPIATSRVGNCVFCQDGYKHLSGDDPALCLDCGTKAESTSDKTTCECYQSSTEKSLFTLKFDPVEATCYKPTELQRPDDFYMPDTQITKSKVLPCEKGYYCDEGIRFPCPGGRYGNKDLEVRNTCAGACEEGHWCGEASTSPAENKCGAVNLFCPYESAAPQYVSEGYYTNEDSPDDSKVTQHICPKGYWCEGGARYPCEAGSFGDSLGLTNSQCSGSCFAGYYCLPGSSSPHQYPCGNSTVFCPIGSKLPKLVDRGYYSASETDTIVVELYDEPVLNATRQMQVLCEIGYYCKYGVKYSCPAGTYGVKTGATDVKDCKPCSPGKYCPSYPGPPTTEDTQLNCGDPNVYCPKGSPQPVNIDLGYYSINESSVTDQDDEVETSQMTSQVQCEPGYYCQNGVRHPCRGGTFGSKPGLMDDNCSGLCPRAYFCPENSVNPLPCSPGSYSTGGAKECTSCEVPSDVPTEVILNSMCRHDRSCCLIFSA